jgi:hypothetical protein
MSTRTLLTAVRRLTQELIPPGEIVAVRMHECQRQADCEAQGRRALGREWRRGDVCIVIMTEDDCSPGPHQHRDEVLIHHRVD